MGIFVEAQTNINAKRMAELEIQLKEQEALQQQQQNLNDNSGDVASSVSAPPPVQVVQA